MKFHTPFTYKYCLRSKKFKKNLKKSNLIIYFMYHILNFYTIIFSIMLSKNRF
jgi:hypothetical protein